MKWFWILCLMMSVLLNVYLVAWMMRTPVKPTAKSSTFQAISDVDSSTTAASRVQGKAVERKWRPQEGVLTYAGNIVGQNLVFSPNVEPPEISKELIEALSLNGAEIAELLKSYAVFLSRIRIEEASVVQTTTDENGNVHIRIPPLKQSLAKHTGALFADFERILGIERANLLEQLAKWDSTIYQLEGTERVVTYMPNGSGTFPGHSYQFRVTRDGENIVDYTSRIHSKEQGVGSAIMDRFEGVIDFNDLIANSFATDHE